MAYPWDIIDYTPRVTGAPYYGILIAKMEELMRKFKKLQVDINEGFTSTLDSKYMKEGKYYTHKILKAIRESNAGINSAVLHSLSSSALVSRSEEIEND